MTCNRIQKFNGRKMVPVSSEDFFLSKRKRFFKPTHDGYCEAGPRIILEAHGIVGPSFDEEGDLCFPCKNAHTFEVSHNKSSSSKISVDLFKTSGPSLHLTYHIDNKGPELPQIPFFSDQGNFLHV